MRSEMTQKLVSTVLETLEDRKSCSFASLFIKRDKKMCGETAKIQRDKLQINIADHDYLLIRRNLSSQ